MSNKKVQFTLVQTMLASLTFEFARIGDSTTTVCEAFLPNGFSVGSGKSACVDPANFDYELGCKYAKENAEADAKNTIWQLEGYLLKVTGNTSDRFSDLATSSISEDSKLFSFGRAVELMKLGRKVARKGWNGSGMFAYYVPASSYPAERGANVKGLFPDDMVPYRHYLALKTAQDDIATWSPSTSDALANDWLLVE